ncbi:uncharacterized protein LOC117611129 isoform X2 [Osmia lignaria lignaria]|uniref:uncharacterized protein LOC117611129 isoform X2 n=1 Tax=Osmia lignaria lignaria TaxID=1437193 RepID=UPI00402B0F10
MSVSVSVSGSGSSCCRLRRLRRVGCAHCGCLMVTLCCASNMAQLPAALSVFLPVIRIIERYHCGPKEFDGCLYLYLDLDHRAADYRGGLMVTLSYASYMAQLPAALSIYLPMIRIIARHCHAGLMSSMGIWIWIWIWIITLQIVGVMELRKIGLRIVVLRFPLT